LAKPEPRRLGGGLLQGQAEARQKQLYAALSIKPDPIGKCKTIIDNKKFNLLN